MLSSISFFSLERHNSNHTFVAFPYYNYQSHDMQSKNLKTDYCCRYENYSSCYLASGLGKIDQRRPAKHVKIPVFSECCNSSKLKQPFELSRMRMIANCYNFSVGPSYAVLGLELNGIIFSYRLLKKSR